MAISIGSYVLDDRTTTVRETYEAVGGKETRLIQITGLLRGVADQGMLVAALDGLLEAASAVSPVYVSLRQGRRLLARREEFSREVHGRHLTGQFALALRADGPGEESDVEHVLPWSIAASGSTVSVTNGGTASTLPVIALEMLGDNYGVQLSDGVRALTYDGLIKAGAMLVVDGPSGQVLLDGVDVTPYTTGDFLQLVPGETVLTYSDDPASSHLIDGTVAFRDRWW